MSTTSDEQVRWLISQMASRMLTRAGDPEPERRAALERAVADWLPGVDAFERRRVAELVAQGFHGMANLVDERRARLEQAGKAAPLGGPGE